MRINRQLATLDIETDPFLFGRTPEPFVVGFYSEKTGFKYFWGDDCIKRAVKFIKKGKYRIYAHNGGKFDYMYFLPYFKKDKVGIINGRISTAYMDKSVFYDSYLILPVPLSNIQKDDIDYGKFEKTEREKHKDEIIHYLANDCHYLYTAVDTFQKLYGRKLTIASTAMNHYTESLRNKGIPIPKSTPFHYEYMRQFYYGGRCQAFKTGVHKGNYTYLDINSAYPYAMTFEHPFTCDCYITKSLNMKKIKQSFIHITATSKGAFPYRTKSGLRFPNDNEPREYFVSGWEYLAAKDTKTFKQLKFHKQVIFKDTTNFKDYIKEFWNLKKQAKKDGDVRLYVISKLLQNSLYGKFAQDPAKFREFKIINPQRDKTAPLVKDGWSMHEMVNDFIQFISRPAKNTMGRYYNIATAASITGFVRAYLWRAICKVKTPLYCDTDSIICENGDALNISDRLGQWEIEMDNIKKVAIGGKKLYACFGDKTKTASKGVKLSAKEIEAIASGEEIHYKFMAPIYSIKKPVSFLTRKIRQTN